MTIQDASVDISQDLKELVGQYKYADDIAPGQMKVSGKFSYGRIDIGLFNQIFFAGTQSVGVKAIQQDEPHSVPGSIAYTVTATNSAGFLTDLGVRYAATGAALTRVTSVSAGGTYSVSAGVYTFFSTDASAGVLISYVYTPTVNTTGKTVPFNQQLMGYGPVFELWLAEAYQQVGGVNNGIHLYACRASKLGQDLKNMDYLKPSMEFQAYANAAGQVGELFQVAT